MVSSPSAQQLTKTIYGFSEDVDMEDSEGKDEGTGKKLDPDFYPQLVNELLEVVLASQESQYLLTAQERDAVRAFQQLPREGRFLFVRLLLRKEGKVHRLAELKYTDVLDKHIKSWVNHLCQSAVRAEDIRNVKVEPDIIDLAGNDEGEKNTEAAEMVNTQAHPDAPDYSVLCYNSNSMSLKDLLQCMTVPELKILGKDVKVNKPPAKKVDLVSAIIATTSTQTLLDRSALSANLKTPKKTETVEAPKKLKQATLGGMYGISTNQSNRLKTMVMKVLDECICVNPDYFALFRRVISIIYLRSTQLPDKLLLPAILDASHKRTYSSELTARRTDGKIWKTRDELLAFEDALVVEYRIDSILSEGSQAAAESAAASISRASRTPARQDEQEHDAAVSPLSVKGADKKRKNSGVDDEAENVRKSIVKAKAIIKEAEAAHEKWRDCIRMVKPEEKAETLEPVSDNDSEDFVKALVRFTPGHVYTRIMCKYVDALHVVKDYDKELKILQELIAQHCWRPSRRGGWYTQRRLVQQKLLDKDDDITLRRQRKDICTGLEEALEDPQTGLLYRPALIKFLTQVERELKIPEDDRHSFSGVLSKPSTFELVAERIRHKTGLELDAVGRSTGKMSAKKKGKMPAIPSGSGPLYRYMTQSASPSKSRVETPGPKAVPKLPTEGSTGRTVWRGEDGNEINVEQRALEHYATLGYKGFHSETKILTMIFALALWDVLFRDIPGAFETRYQKEPLDLREDSFYSSRADLIDARLAEIEEEGKMKDLILARKADWEAETCCVGVHWDICTEEDLLEIVECIGDKPLAEICLLFCQDYGACSSGAPDLVIWNYEDKTCKFVEVKSEKDRTQKNQDLWFDMLMMRGVEVEICKVVETKSEPKVKAKAKSKAERAKEHSDSGNDDDPKHASKKSKTSAKKEPAKRRKLPTNSDDDGSPKPKKASKKPKSSAKIVDSDSNDNDNDDDMADEKVDQLAGDDEDYTPSHPAVASRSTSRQVDSASTKKRKRADLIDSDGELSLAKCKRASNNSDDEDEEQFTLPVHSTPAETNPLLAPPSSPRTVPSPSATQPLLSSTPTSLGVRAFMWSETKRRRLAS